VDLYRHILRPRGPELGDRQAAMEEQRPSSSGPGLSQPLRRHGPQPEAGIDELDREAIRGSRAALDELAKADLRGVGDSLVENFESAAVEEIGRVHRMPASAQFVGEGQEPGRLALRVVEKQHFSHVAPCGQWVEAH
jgi:hypothetical protein